MPARSLIEKPPPVFDARVEVTAPPPAVADEVAVIVHTVDVVWVKETIVRFVVVKSSAESRSVHRICSFPVIVKKTVLETDVAADAASVTVGAVVSVVY